MNSGKFIISLDFELHWGAVEKWDINTKCTYLKNARLGVSSILSLFKKYKIHATWATVGFLFAQSKQQLVLFSPKIRPEYLNDNLSYYQLIDDNVIGDNENDDPYHYAPSLINAIIDTPNQELASHTFSHYYCNEQGQNEKQFEADIEAAQNIARENFNIELQSLVLPRNQFNPNYLEISKKYGIKVVRSNPDVWFWKNKIKFASLARAFDTLLPISKSLSYDTNGVNSDDVLLLPASRFLRPYNEREKFIKTLKLLRIKKEMTYAAKNNKVYHLWWHPHNFGNSLETNLEILENILIHFVRLKNKYGFESKSMIEMYEV